MSVSSLSFAGRILLALALMIGFYVLALGIALGLILIPVAEVVFANQIHPKLAIFCVIGGGMILWSVLPRWDRFQAPGPRLDPKDQPELFKEIKAVADLTGQRVPAEVYAVPELNAWVADRGGILGLGSRRVMGLGVPLMQVLSTQEFRGVLAHEFGHYYSGDTKLGPWFYVTRSAITRTVIHLAQSGSTGLVKFFQGYLMFFLKVTQKDSRRQEFTADALAARTIGPQAIAQALKTVHSNALAFDVYWQQEYVPVLQSGYRTPLCEGFRSFFESSKVRTAMDKALATALTDSKTDPYDSHPPLKERLDAIATESGPRLPERDPPFIHVVRNLDNLEVAMIEHLAKLIKEKVPASLPWSDVAEKVWVPQWKQMLREYAGDLKGLKVWQWFELLGSDQHVERLIAPNLLRQVTGTAERKQIAMNVVAVATLLTLRQNGWTIDAAVGKDVAAVAGGARIEPFVWMSDWQEGKCSLQDLEDRCDDYGIDQLELMLEP